MCSAFFPTNTCLLFHPGALPGMFCPNTGERILSMPVRFAKQIAPALSITNAPKARLKKGYNRSIGLNLPDQPANPVLFSSTFHFSHMVPAFTGIDR